MTDEPTAVHYDPEDPHDRHMAELDIAHGMHESPVRRLFLVLAVAVPVLALMNSQGLVKWANTLPENPFIEEIIVGAAKWRELTESLGTADLFDAIREAFYGFREEPSLLMGR
jgi:hypothetical protein